MKGEKKIKNKPILLTAEAEIEMAKMKGKGKIYFDAFFFFSFFLE